MGIIKARPKIRLLIPRALFPGQTVEATVVLEVRRPVPLEFLDVSLEGTERTSAGSRANSKLLITRVGGRLCNERDLPAGRSEFPCTFHIPGDAPPSHYGTLCAISYVVSIHAAIPWWPDRRSAFEVVVRTPPVQGDGAPQLLSSAPEGYQGQEPYMEVSLASDVVEAGGVLQGAVALYNVQHNSYRAIEAALVSTEMITVGGYRKVNTSDEHRYQLALEQLTDGSSLPLRLRLPSTIKPSFKSTICTFSWVLRLRASMPWRKTLDFGVAITLVAPTTASANPRQFRAPPSVGNERMMLIWRKVASEAGYVQAEGGETLERTEEGVAISIAREHRGDQGVFLVATLSYQPLHLELRLDSVRGRLRRRGAIKLGSPNFDTKYRLHAREAQQARVVFLGSFTGHGISLAAALESELAAEMTDERLTILQRGSGQNMVRLRRFATRARATAQLLAQVRRHIPPPAIMAPAVTSWEGLARHLGGQLELARMAVAGHFDGMPCQVRTEWWQGEAISTALVLRPPLGLASTGRFNIRRGEEIKQDISDLPMAAQELLLEIFLPAADGACPVKGVRLTTEELRLDLDAPLLDTTPVHRYLRRLARLAGLLLPDHGPYR